MTTKCRIINEEYVVKDGKKVTCILTWKNPVTGNICKAKASANCNPEDEFDFSFGKKLSHSRATYNLVYRFLSSVVSYVNSLQRYSDIMLNEIDFQNNLIK